MIMDGTPISRWMWWSWVLVGWRLVGSAEVVSPGASRPCRGWSCAMIPNRWRPGIPSLWLAECVAPGTRLWHRRDLCWRVSSASHMPWSERRCVLGHGDPRAPRQFGCHRRGQMWTSIAPIDRSVGRCGWEGWNGSDTTPPIRSVVEVEVHPRDCSV